MEARSLASLNFLAANPPQYPTKPNEERQEPLTLYISRVPGTRDIILSPFKPQIKNVTSEDVASCLYYVHLDTTRGQEPTIWRNNEGEDDRLRSRVSEDDARSIYTIPRKPIAGAGRPVTPESPPSEPNHTSPRGMPNSHFSPGSVPLEDSGIGLPDMAAGPSQPSAAPPTRFPSRKPVRPQARVDVPADVRPPTSGTDMTRGPPPEYSLEVSEEQSFSVRDPSINPPPLYIAHPATAVSPQSRSPSPKKQPGSFNLSLIRRDPSSGNQWNIGTIESHQIENSSPQGAIIPSTNRPPIDVCIETSGYAKFRGMPAQRGGDDFPSQLHDGAQMSTQAHGGMFSRQIVMMYTKSFASNLKEKFHKLDKNRTSLNNSHSRGQSLDTALQDLMTPDAPTTQPGPGLKPRGYVFSSPWGGRCEFRTGNAGRSVRLHHFLHNTDTSAFNPLVADQQGSQSTNTSPSSVVSELRFNLPSSEIISSSPSAPDDLDRTLDIPKIGNLGKFWRRSSDSSEYDDDDISPFDVNLGKEKAGGGNRGKRAKMGKLIIGHDGLKMLDLVVAANVGVWWGAWEKSF